MNEGTGFFDRKNECENRKKLMQKEEHCGKCQIKSLPEDILVKCLILEDVIKEVKKPKNIKIIKALWEAKKPLTVNELKVKTGISHAGIYRHINKLYDIGILMKSNDKPCQIDVTPFTIEILTM